MTEHDAMQYDRREGWTLDKTISMPLVLMIFMQTVGLVIWGAKLDGRVSTLEAKIAENNGQAERLIRLDERMSAVQTSMGEMRLLLQAQNGPALAPARSSSNVR